MVTRLLRLGEKDSGLRLDRNPYRKWWSYTVFTVPRTGPSTRHS